VSSTAGHQFVSGRRTAAAGDGDYDVDRMPVINPATGAVVVEAELAGLADVDSAVREMPHGGYAMSGFGKDMSTYSFEEYTLVKHVMLDNTGDARKAWHRTIFGGGQA
jgi:acyl-CoA reductase-like NAD-dependent aldehyde dehydrogenase